MTAGICLHQKMLCNWKCSHSPTIVPFTWRTNWVLIPLGRTPHAKTSPRTAPLSWQCSGFRTPHCLRAKITILKCSPPGRDHGCCSDCAFLTWVYVENVMESNRSSSGCEGRHSTQNTVHSEWARWPHHSRGARVQAGVICKGQGFWTPHAGGALISRL